MMSRWERPKLSAHRPTVPASANVPVMRVINVVGAVATAVPVVKCRLAKSDKQEQATAFQHVLGVKCDTLGLQTPTRNGVR